MPTPEELRRRLRLLLGLPPEIPSAPAPRNPFEEYLSPVAVPAGTRERPPKQPMYGPNDPRSRNLATAKTIPPSLQKAADILSPKGSPSRKVFSLLGALSTADPERDVAAELQQANPILKLMMGGPVGVPVGSLAGTVGRGVLTQTGRAASQAAQKAAPAARRLVTEEAGAVGKGLTADSRLNIMGMQGNRNALESAGVRFTTAEPSIKEIVTAFDDLFDRNMALPRRATIQKENLRNASLLLQQIVKTQSGKSFSEIRQIAEMPVTKPVASEALSPAAKAAQATEEAGAIRPMTPGVSRPATPKPVEIPGMPGEPGRKLTTPGVSRPLTPRISRPKQLSDTEVELLRLDNEANQLQGEISLRTGAASEMQGIVRPPANAPNGVGRLSEARLRALAAQERVNPYREDWWDSIDPVAVRDIRSSPSPSRGATTTSLKTLRMRLADTQAQIREIQTGGVAQAGMGIGERPAQGGLFENLQGQADKIPLADTEQMALRQQRQARIAAGQAEMPITTPVASEALSPAAKAAQATEGVARAWATGAPRPFAFDPNSTVNQGRFRLLPPIKGGSYITRQSGTSGVSYIVDTKSNAIQAVRFNKTLMPEAKAAQWWEANAARLGREVPVGAETRAVSESVQQIPKKLSESVEQSITPTGAKTAGQGVQPPTPGAAVPPAKPLVRTPSEATAQVKAVQQEGLKAPDTVELQAAKKAHIEMGAPDGPQPPKPPRPTAKGATPPPDEPVDIVRQIAAKATQGERPDQTLLRLHEAAIGNEARRNGIIVRDGNAKLKTLGIGVTRRGQLIPRTEDVPKLDELYNALHNPTKVASGEMKVPEGYGAIYAELRRLTDWEQAARLDFDPAMATVDDYFYRGWKPPEGAFATGVSQGRPLVKTPAFKKPRVDATYKEMRDAGFEPLFWNPYQQWGLSRMQGTKYREQMELVDYLKGMGDDFARPHAGGPIPDGWRVPEVGPAFEGKPFATLDAAGEPTRMFTRRWIVPDRVANTLENIYGKRLDLGKLIIGGKTIDPLSVIDFLTFVPKRAKLMFSLFQQVDFLGRAGAGGWTRMADALSAGQPIQAVKALAQYPASAVKIIRSNFSPEYRQSLARQLDSTVPLIKGRAGVNLKGVSEAGLSTFDPAMFQWEDMDKVVREVAQETGVLGKARGAARAVGDLESAMRRGLFEGVYPAAMITDIQNNIAPMVARMYPKLNDAQLNGTIARIVNIKYSSIPASQSVLQNRVLRETLRRVFFSIGESEGLLRQAAGLVSGPNKKFWMKHWLGTYLFVIATASAIHYASTGKPLPKERFTPVSKDKWGPLPFGYNTRFASPTIPLKGRGGAELTLDVVGQMDTALRILNPGQFITARESVPIRATVNQASGTDFFGNRIDDVGPGGVVSRTAQLIQDMYSPIGAGGLASEAARRNIPGAEQVIQEGETRLGMPGLGVQATGLNLRAATREQRLKSTLGQQAVTTLKAMDKLGVDLGYVTRKFDTTFKQKGGEITLTSEQREQLQWLTDDTVIRGLQTFNFNTPVKSKEDLKASLRKKMEELRADARTKFRMKLRQQGVTATPKTPAPPTATSKQTPADAAAIQAYQDASRKAQEYLDGLRQSTLEPVGAK